MLMQLSDRIMVMCGGRVSGIVDPREVTKEDIGLMMIHAEHSASGDKDGEVTHEFTRHTGKRASFKNGKTGYSVTEKSVGHSCGCIILSLVTGGIVILCLGHNPVFVYISM